MRRTALFLLVLFILTVNISPSYAPVARGNESYQPDFSPAADGATSTDSISSFSETSSDDTMQGLEADSTLEQTRNDSVGYWDDCSSAAKWGAIAGNPEPDSVASDGDTLTMTVEQPASWDYIQTGHWEPEGEKLHPTGQSVLTRFYWEANATFSGYADILIMISDEEGESEGRSHTLSPIVNLTAYAADTWHTVVSDPIAHSAYMDSYPYVAGLTIRFSLTPDDPLNITMQFEYMVVTIPGYGYEDSGYAESFADVSDWSTSDTSISSDGDLATITENGAGSTGRAYASFSSTDYFEYYYEFSIDSMTATTASLQFYDGAGWHTLHTFTAAGTYKGIISNTDATTMERIGFLVGSDSGNIRPDYLRIAPADEMGWGHDGSTTAGVTTNSPGDTTFTYSSDGDILNMTAERTGSGNAWTDFFISYDTTTTSADLSSTYYPFFEALLHVEMNSTSDEDVQFRVYYDSKVVITSISDFGSYTTYRMNIEAGDANTESKIWFRCNLGGIGESYTVLWDYGKAYSIADYTIWGDDGTWSTSDYAYVDASGNLQIELDDSGYSWMNFEYDPTLSVSTTTYNVWNLSGTFDDFSGANDDYQLFAKFGGGWVEQDREETRGDWTSTSTLTDILFKVKSRTEALSHTLSAITFIEDATAPDILDKYIDPKEPDDDEDVTLTVVAYDALEVWSVTINAIVSPAGFSDVDYSMTETSQEHVFTYEFSTLTAGYYLFALTADDAANTYTEYISVRVRTGTIIISPITFFGVGEDFTQMQMSFEINRDCSYTIYESSASYSESDTHTGSVTEGWSNIAWDKISVTDTSANFSIQFVNGTLSTWINGSYSIAQTTFYVMQGRTVFDYGTVRVSGRITKLASYTVYDDDDNVQATGTITSLDFTLSFSKWELGTGNEVNFTIMFTNGSQTCYYEDSYLALKQWDAYEGRGGGDTEDFTEADRLTIGFWGFVTLGGLAVLGFATAVKMNKIEQRLTRRYNN